MIAGITEHQWTVAIAIAEAANGLTRSPALKVTVTIANGDQMLRLEAIQ